MSLAVNTHSLSLNIANNLNNNQAKLSTATSATATFTQTDTATDTVNISNATSGAKQKSASSLQSSVENIAATLAHIKNEGFAKQSANLLREQFTQHPLTAMLAQANQSPQDVLALLR